MKDLIYKRAAIDAMCDNCDTVNADCAHYPCSRYVAVVELPSAQPQSTMGQQTGTAQSTNDLISRQAVDKIIDGLLENDNLQASPSVWYGLHMIKQLPSAQQWIPVKTRPMTEEERQYLEEHTGIELEDEDAVFFDCQMPDDGQEVWVCYKSGTVSEDVCEIDDFCGLEGNGDWWDIVAWMPRIKPEPWKGEDDE